jgi:hypothetical protein
MVGKSNLPSDVESRTGLRGSSLDSYVSALDQERAASMADEGGSAGAVMDTREQHAAARRDRAPEPERRGWLLWGAIAAGCAVLAGSLFAHYRRR